MDLKQIHAFGAEYLRFSVIGTALVQQPRLASSTDLLRDRMLYIVNWRVSTPPCTKLTLEEHNRMRLNELCETWGVNDDLSRQWLLVIETTFMGRKATLRKLCAESHFANLIEDTLESFVEYASVNAIVVMSICEIILKALEELRLSCIVQDARIDH